MIAALGLFPSEAGRSPLVESHDEDVTGQAWDGVIQRRRVAPGLIIRRFAREKGSKIGEPLALQ